MIPNNNRLIYLKFKKQPLNRKWFVIVVVFSLWIQLLMGVTINFEDLEPGKRGENNYHVWVYFKDKNDGNIRNKEFYFSFHFQSRFRHDDNCSFTRSSRLLAIFTMTVMS